MFVSFSCKGFLLMSAALCCGRAVLAQTPYSTSSSSSSPAPSSSSSSEAAALPNAPSARWVAPPNHSAKPPYAVGGYAGPAQVHAACGGGLDYLQGRSQGALAMCGVGFSIIPFAAMELGGVRLQDGSAHFYLSEDATVPLSRVSKRLRGESIGIFGYTKIVGNSNRLDYGLGWEHHVGPSQSVGLEVRDYVQFTDPVQHAVVLRLALVGGSDFIE